jgi:hypothetical protein
VNLDEAVDTGDQPENTPPSAPPTGIPRRAPTGAVRPPTGSIRPGTGSIRPGTGAIRPGTGSLGPSAGGPPSRSSSTIAGGGAGAPPSTQTTAGATRGPGQTGVPPHSKASDLLRGHPNYKAQETRENKPFLPLLTEERRPTRADDAVIAVLWTAIGVVACCLVYYLWGLFSGSLSTEHFRALDASNKSRILGNIGLAHTILEYALYVGVAAILFLFYDEAFSGYCLLLLAVFLQVGLPFVGSQYFALSRMAEGDAARQMYKDAQTVAWVPGIPGLILIGMDLIRKFISGLQEARFKRKHLQYGQGVVKQAKSRNVFLGFCWDMPYCRDEVRVKCPIFLRKRGPCWRTKRGCMCDETIVLNANAENWKAKVDAADQSIKQGAKAKPRPVASISPQQMMSDAFKRERCRQCVIYNTHQEQKYKALVGVTFAAAAVALYMFSGIFLNSVITGYKQMDKMTTRLSFAANPQSHTGIKTPPPSSGRPAPTTGAEVMEGASTDMSTPVAWVLLAIVTVVLLSKFLNFIEYICFKLKL